MNLYEILVPTIHRRTGKPIRARFHRVWDGKVREIAGGLTILKPAKGQWLDRQNLYIERMIPVRIACDENQMRSICDFTAQYYGQLAVMYYKLSSDVFVINYSKST